MDRLEKIAKIAKHYSKKISGLHCGDLTMEIDIVDKMHNLDLDRMLEDLDSFHVQHDVIGIWMHLDRKTKKLRDCWLPRFGLGQDWEEIQDAQQWELEKSLD